MAGETVNSNVGVNINPQGLESAAKQVQNQVRLVAKELETAGDKFNAKLKQASLEMKRMQAVAGLQGFEAKRMLGPMQDFNLGKQIRQMQDWQLGMRGAGDGMQALRGRLAAFNLEAKRAASDKSFTATPVFNTQKIEQTAKAYGKITNEIQGMRGRIALLSEDGKRAFQPMLRSMEELDRKNSRMFANSGRFDFSAETRSMQMMAQGMKERLVAREKIEAKTRLNIESLREEARQLLTNSRIEREAALAKSVRTGMTTLGNRDLIGSAAPYRRQSDLLQREADQTRFLTLAKRQLNAEYAKPVEAQSAGRIQQLIARYQALHREIGQTIAMRAREAAMPQPTAGGGGFFGGVKAGIGRVTGMGGEDGGGAFGAGALVGRVASYAVAAAAIYGLVSAIKEGIGFAIQFEDALAQLKAISGSTSTEMERLSSGIFAVSRNSANSVMELTKSATVIAQAGYAGAEIQEMLQSVVNLSAASGASTDESVEILTSALGAFQMSASEASRVTDILVSSLNESKLSVQQMQLGLQYLGNTAAENNISFEELAASMATMADAGIRSGSTAATGLRQMLVDFMDPSEKLITQLTKIGLTTADIDVKTLGLSTVLTRLRDAGFEAYGTLETRGSAAYVAMSRNIEHTEELLRATEKQGVAEDAAAERANSLSARWQQMFNQLARVGNELGQNFIPLLKILVELLGGVAIAVASVAASLTYPLRLFGLLTETTEDMSVNLEQAAASFEAAGYSSGEAAAKAAEMGDSLGDVTTALKDTEAQMASTETEQASLRSETEKLIMRSDELAGANGNLNVTTSGVSAAVSTLASRFPGLRDEFDKTRGGVAGLIQAMAALDLKAQQTLRNLAQTGLAQADMQRQASLRTLGGASGALLRRRVGEEYTGRLSDPAFVEKRTRVQALLRQNTTESLRTAHRIMMTDRRFQNGPDFGRLTSALQQYDTARGQVDTHRENLGTAEFALSAPGQELLGTIASNNGRSARAASQGSHNGASRAQVAAQIRAQEARFAEIEQATKNNPYAASLLQEARNSANAATNRLTPEPDKKAEAAAKKAATAAERASQKRERDNQRRANELDRIDGKIAKEELELRKEMYENAVDAFKNSPDLANMDELLDTIDTSLAKWLGAEAETAMQEIEALHPTVPQRRAMMAAAGRKAEEMRESEITKLGDELAGIVKAYIDTTTKAIERQFTEAMRFTERNVALAQGRLDGLNNPLNNGRVPDYMKTVAQRELDLANDRNDRAGQGAGATRLARYEAMLAKAQADKAEVERRLQNIGTLRPESSADEIVVTGMRENATRELRQLDDVLLKVNDDISAQQLELDKLAASYGALAGAPTTFGDGIRMAAQAAAIDLGHVGSLGQELINGLGAPLQALHEGFKGFFSDMLSGSVSVGQAFKNLAGSVIDAINQMVAVALAKKFFSLVLGLFGPPGAGTGAEAGVEVPSFGNAWNGGELTRNGKGTLSARRMYGGGSVLGGMGTRDSTLVHAAQGEFMLRRPAVQSIGADFLNDMNTRGAAALRDVGPAQAPAPVAAPPVYTSVYVIAPEEKPQMGPNDILATFSNDVLKGGVTKKLIKRVAAGG